ncbi:Uncharacterised protein [Vibrio cholerae]|nr:Uncharacterised protein [Vibrio cholerae]CSB16720.1 Uncharacterised protein [Vibrio cholerae]
MSLGKQRGDFIDWAAHVKGSHRPQYRSEHHFAGIGHRCQKLIEPQHTAGNRCTD